MPEKIFSNYRKDIKNLNAIPAFKRFYKHNHDDNNHGKFIIIEQLRNTSTTSTETSWSEPRPKMTSCHAYTAYGLK